MITHYCLTLEEALKKAKQAGKQPGCEYWGITISGKKGFAVYKNGFLVERYLFFNKKEIPLQRGVCNRPKGRGSP